MSQSTPTFDFEEVCQSWFGERPHVFITNQRAFLKSVASLMSLVHDRDCNRQPNETAVVEAAIPKRQVDAEVFAEEL
jgi:hypothetical protein